MKNGIPRVAQAEENYKCRVVVVVVTEGARLAQGTVPNGTKLSEVFLNSKKLNVDKGRYIVYRDHRYFGHEKKSYRR